MSGQNTTRFASYYNSDIDNLEALIDLESHSHNKYEFANLHFTIRTLNVKPEKLPELHLHTFRVDLLIVEIGTRDVFLPCALNLKPKKMPVCKAIAEFTE